jgi:putative colanic acid biosynthesis UDP-glucose lipid carrier transferase
VVIIGNGKHASAIYHEIKSGDYGYKILGAFSDSQTPRHSPLHHLGSIVDVNKFCIENSVDEIYCTLPRDSESDIIQLINFAEKNMIRFFLVPEFYEYIRRNPVISLLQSIPVIAIRPEPLQLVHNRVIKRIFDILFSTVILLTIFPVVFIIFGFFIKITSRGSIFFTQNRTGLQGKTFKCYKFRSMTLNEESDEKIASRSDARITLVGAFMRRTSIDELPQFFNVLIGNMSVVGPRPHMLKQTYLYAKLIDKFMIRHIIKPGITGWAQMSGYRGETKTIEQMEGRLKRDVWYIENWSFILDLKIIAVTIFQILKGDKKAY